MEMIAERDVSLFILDLNRHAERCRSREAGTRQQRALALGFSLMLQSL